MSRSEQPRYLDGNALYRKRAEAGLEQAQLAERCGAKQGQISGWERGHTGCRLAMLHTLARVLDQAIKDSNPDGGCTVMDLLRDGSKDSTGSTEDDETEAAA